MVECLRKLKWNRNSNSAKIIVRILNKLHQIEFYIKIFYPCLLCIHTLKLYVNQINIITHWQKQFSHQKLMLHVHRNSDGNGKRTGISNDNDKSNANRNQKIKWREWEYEQIIWSTHFLIKQSVQPKREQRKCTTSFSMSSYIWKAYLIFQMFSIFFCQSPNRKLYKIVSGCCCLKLGSIIVIIKGANGKCTKRNGMDRKVLENRQILWWSEKGMKSRKSRRIETRSNA